MADSDWKDWLQMSEDLGLGPFESFMSWTSYCKEDDKEVFKVCVQEKVGMKPSSVGWISDFIESLHDDVCGDQIVQTHPNHDSNESCKLDASGVIDGAIGIAKKLSKYSCGDCEKNFKDQSHLSEHRDRMHADSAPCLICNMMFQDKFSALDHQKTCMRKCSYSHCSFQTKHKHTFLKHLRGHANFLRRF
jgi:hypothetical protein